MTVLCKQPEAFSSNLGDDQSRYLYLNIWLFDFYSFHCCIRLTNSPSLKFMWLLIGYWSTFAGCTICWPCDFYLWPLMVDVFQMWYLRGDHITSRHIIQYTGLAVLLVWVERGFSLIIFVHVMHEIYEVWWLYPCFFFGFLLGSPYFHNGLLVTGTMDNWGANFNCLCHFVLDL